VENSKIKLHDGAHAQKFSRTFQDKIPNSPIFKDLPGRNLNSRTFQDNTCYTYYFK